MPGNKFELEQVLKYRKDVERQCKEEFASAKQVFDIASDKLLEESEKVEDLSREFTNRQGEI